MKFVPHIRRLLDDETVPARFYVGVAAMSVAAIGATALLVGLYTNSDQDNAAAVRDVAIATSTARMNTDIRDVLTQREQAITKDSGSIVIMTGKDQCVERKFDNATGKMGTVGNVACDARIETRKAGPGSNARMQGLLSTFNK